MELLKEADIYISTLPNEIRELHELQETVRNAIYNRNIINELHDVMKQKKYLITETEKPFEDDITESMYKKIRNEIYKTVSNAIHNLCSDNEDQYETIEYLIDTFNRVITPYDVEMACMYGHTKTVELLLREIEKTIDNPLENEYYLAHACMYVVIH
jgi:predicted RNase H-like nuclease (RuvC/YqgF family)